jgi:hypothetical protein
MVARDVPDLAPCPRNVSEIVRRHVHVAKQRGMKAEVPERFFCGRARHHETVDDRPPLLRDAMRLRWCLFARHLCLYPPGHTSSNKYGSFSVALAVSFIPV